MLWWKEISVRFIHFWIGSRWQLFYFSNSVMQCYVVIEFKFTSDLYACWIYEIKYYIIIKLLKQTTSMSWETCIWSVCDVLFVLSTCVKLFSPTINFLLFNFFLPARNSGNRHHLLGYICQCIFSLLLFCMWVHINELLTTAWNWAA